MPNDPLAVPSALRSLESFLERLTGELRDRRGPLERAGSDLLLAWDADFGRHKLAVRLAAVGAAVRVAGLSDEVQRLHAARAARLKQVTGNECLVALALLDATVSEQHENVADLLARLHDEYRALLPGVRVALARVAEQLLVVWCDLHAVDFPARFRDEVLRLQLDPHLVEQWHLDHKPHLTDAAALVLDGLLDGVPFTVGWLDEVPDAGVPDEIADGVTDTTADEVGGERNPSRRRHTPKIEAGILVRDYLLKHGKADPDAVTVKAIAAATGVSTGGVSGAAVWKAFHAERTKRRSGKLRTVPLTCDMLAVVPDVKFRRDEERELAALIAEQELDDDDRRPARRERSRRS